MSEQQNDFALRVGRLNSKRGKAVRNSQSAFIDADGYVVVSGYRRSRGLPKLGLLVLAFGFFGIKGAMIAQMGPENYAVKLNEISQSESVVASIGVWTMQPDMVSSYVAQHLGSLL